MQWSVKVLAATALCATTFALASAAPARASLNSAGETHAVERTIRDWYDASVRRDSVAYARAMLPTFFIFEDTTRLSRDDLLRLVFGSPSTGVDRATLYEFNTQVRGDVAWTSFRNDEVFTPIGAPGLPVRRFLETVVLRRVGGVWRMERYHATRINRPPPR